MIDYGLYKIICKATDIIEDHRRAEHSDLLSFDTEGLAERDEITQKDWEMALEVLSNENIIKFESKTEEHEEYIDRPFEKPPKYSVTFYKVEIINPLEKLVSEIRKTFVETGNQTEAKQSTLIAKDTRGEFRNNGNLIKFKRKKTISYYLFDYLYKHSRSVLKDEPCTYEELNQYFEDCGEESIEDPARQKDRVRNAKDNLIHRKMLPKMAPDGEHESIIVVPGIGLMLYNPQL